MGNVGNGADGNSWLSYGVDNLMGLVVGTGLVDWLFDMYFSGDWSMTGSVPKTGFWARTGLAEKVLVMIGAGWMVLMAAGWWTWVCSATGMVW